MAQFYSFLQSWWVLIAALALQFYLVKQPKKWMSFILPGIYFLLSMVDMVRVVQSEIVLMDSLFLTILMVFVTENIYTVLFLIVYFMRGAGVGPTIVALFLTFVAAMLLLSFGAISAALWTASADMKAISLTMTQVCF